MGFSTGWSSEKADSIDVKSEVVRRGFGREWTKAANWRYLQWSKGVAVELGSNVHRCEQVTGGQRNGSYWCQTPLFCSSTHRCRIVNTMFEPLAVGNCIEIQPALSESSWSIVTLWAQKKQIPEVRREVKRSPVSLRGNLVDLQLALENNCMQIISEWQSKTTWINCLWMNKETILPVLNKLQLEPQWSLA